MSDPILFIGDEASVFVSRTQDELKKIGLDVSVWDVDDQPTKKLTGKLSKAIFLARKIRNGRTFFRNESSRGTIVAHYLGIDFLLNASFYRKKANRFIAIAYGSDILRRRRYLDFVMRRALKYLDVLVVTNENIRVEICSSFPDVGSKVKVIRFGLPVLDQIDLLEKEKFCKEDAKRSFGFQLDKKSILLGYCSQAGQRQKELIEMAYESCEKLQHCQFIVPVQYGDERTTAEISLLCKSLNRKSSHSNLFTLLEDFMDTVQTAKLRKATDVLINNSETDSFSGTVQESIYSGATVLSSERLPYDTMPGWKTSTYGYASAYDLPKMLQKKHLERLEVIKAQNLDSVKSEIFRISSWKYVGQSWQQLLSD